MKSQFDQAAPSAPVQSTCRSTKTRARSSRASNLLSLSLFALGSWGALGCQKEEKKGGEPKERPSDPAEHRPSSQKKLSEATQSLLDLKSQCSFEEGGLTIDLGSPTAESRRMFRLTSEATPEFSTRLGQNFRVFDQMNTDFVFWTTEVLSEFEVQAAVHGLSSERIALYIDGKRLGAAKLKDGVTRKMSISARDLELASGRHKLTVSLSRPKSGPPSAELGWLRLTQRGGASTDQPATEDETFAEVTVDKERHQSIILRPRGKLRCPLWIPPGTMLTTQIGVWGEGDNEAEIVVHTDKGERHVVLRDARKKDEPRAWKSATIDLKRFGSQFIELELLSHSSQGSSRSAFAMPTLKNQVPSHAKAPPARRAIVVILSGLGQHHAPPAAGLHGLPFLNQLTEEGTFFRNYRSSTTSENGIIASLLTGVAPWRHQVHDKNGMLPVELPTLAGAVESSGGRSSFFSGSPFSFPDFGFDRGFELFDSIGPQQDFAATEPLTRAKAWLKKSLPHEGPVLSLIHLRGGHPPFDVSKDVARKLPPAEYGGNLTPRRAAIQLADIRNRRSSLRRRMPDEDWVRMQSLQKEALLRQDEELSQLLSWLREEAAYEDSLIIIVGDAASGERPDMPFSSEAPLSEAYLGVPLIVKFPRGHMRGAHIKGHFAPRDLTATIAESLGVEFRADKDAIHLADASASAESRVRPHLAYRDGHYSMRVGETLLIGRDGKAPLLCFPELDPNCQTDRSNRNIPEARTLWLRTWSTLAPSLESSDSKTREGKNEVLENALLVWGVPE